MPNRIFGEMLKRIAIENSDNLGINNLEFFKGHSIKRITYNKEAPAYVRRIER